MKTALKEVSQGQEFTLAGIKWVVLDHFTEEVFVLAADVLKEKAFDGNSNNWKESTIRKYLENDFLEHLIEEGVPLGKIHEMVINLISDDGMIDYGIDNEKIALLTVDQYRQYRRFIPNASEWWWLATPYSCNVSYPHHVCIVDMDGSLISAKVYYEYGGVRPACFLSSDIMVEIEGGDNTENTQSDDVPDIGVGKNYNPKGRTESSMTILGDVLKEVYCSGYADGLSDRIENDYNKGHEDDMIDAAVNTNEAYDKGVTEGYNKGVAEAWEAARKIVVFNASEGGLSLGEMNDLFGTPTVSATMREVTALDAITKIKEFEEVKSDLDFGSMPTDRQEIG